MSAPVRYADDGGLIASGVHTMGILQRLTVDAVWSTFPIVIGHSCHELRMPRPLRPGDTVTGTLEWNRVEHRGHRRARVSHTNRLRDEAGELMFEISGTVIIPLRRGLTTLG